jgi:site-specific DNA-methyltransferase (adenine-specific)
MRLMPLTDIFVREGRQRKVFNEKKMQDLSNSMQSGVGLIHPPLVLPTGELVAGENRLRVIKDLAANEIPIMHDGATVPLGMCPVTVLGTDDAAVAFRAEFDENDARTQLSWQERAEALARLHEYLGGNASDTAKRAFGTVGGHQVKDIKQAIILAKHLGRDDIAKAGNADDAMKILEREDERARLLASGKLILEMTPAEKHQLHNANCLDWLRAYEGEKFKCIITDPPYGIGADTVAPYGSQAGRGEHNYDDSFKGFDSLMQPLPSLMFNVTDSDAHVWLFCDVRRFGYLYDRFTAAGFWCYPYPVIRQYGGGSGRVYPKCQLRRDYDCLLFAMKGQRPCKGLGADILPGTGRLPTNEKLDFGPQKPVAVYRELLKRSAEPGWRILDIFAGSGTILDACEQMKMRAVAVEVDPAHYAMCKERLAALSKPTPKETPDVSSSF